MTTREWATVEEHIASTLPSQPYQPSQQEETMSSAVPAALDAIWQQATALETDAVSNPLAVILTARHVGKSFTPAECVAVADFLAAIEAEKRARQQQLAPYQDMAPVNGTGPQRVLQ